MKIFDAFTAAPGAVITFDANAIAARLVLQQYIVGTNGNTAWVDLARAGDPGIEGVEIVELGAKLRFILYKNPDRKTIQ